MWIDLQTVQISSRNMGDVASRQTWLKMRKMGSNYVDMLRVIGQSDWLEMAMDCQRWPYHASQAEMSSGLVLGSVAWHAVTWGQ